MTEISARPGAAKKKPTRQSTTPVELQEGKKYLQVSKYASRQKTLVTSPLSK